MDFIPSWHFIYSLDSLTGLIRIIRIFANQVINLQNKFIPISLCKRSFGDKLNVVEVAEVF